MLTHSSGKLIGIVFTRFPLPDLNGGNGMPQASMPAATPNTSGAGINPQLLANLQNTANMGMMNNANNANVQMLQNSLRQQQLMNAVAMGSPVSGAQQPGMNGKTWSLLFRHFVIETPPLFFRPELQ